MSKIGLGSFLLTYHDCHSLSVTLLSLMFVMSGLCFLRRFCALMMK